VLDLVLDVSHWNEVTSWQAIKDSGIIGIIHKSSQGLFYADPTYHERREAALAAGLLWGAYHFGECGDPEAQAENFLAMVQPEPTDLLVLDFEPCDNTMSVAEAETFVTQVWQDTGRAPGLYAGQSFLTDCMEGCAHTRLASCWLWLARYSTEMPEVPPLWDTFSLWQYTDQGTVPGITGPVDRNRWNGSIEGLYRLWGIEPTLLVV
jgi:lysozyme